MRGRAGEVGYARPLPFACKPGVQSGREGACTPPTCAPHVPPSWLCPPRCTLLPLGAPCVHPPPGRVPCVYPILPGAPCVPPGPWSRLRPPVCTLLLLGAPHAHLTPGRVPTPCAPPSSTGPRLGGGGHALSSGATSPAPHSCVNGGGGLGVNGDAPVYA